MKPAGGAVSGRDGPQGRPPSLSGQLPFFFSLSIVLLAAWTLPSTCRAQREWPPIPPEEFALKDNPAEPGAHAIILYREDVEDDVLGQEKVYVRLKIFTQEGVEHGDVLIPYNAEYMRVENIQARTIRPDGGVVAFDGQVFEQEIVRAGGIKRLAKTFSLPNVQPGCILEYRYTLRWDPKLHLPTTWMLQSKLFTRRGHFSIRPDLEGPLAPLMAFSSVTFLVPSKSALLGEKARARVLDIENYPRYVEETHMPPEREVRSRVEFFYSFGSWDSPQAFWISRGKDRNRDSEEFMSRHKAVEGLVKETVSPSDPPEAKLRKLYARAQRFRNLSFEPSRTEKEEKKEKLEQTNNVDDIVKGGYGRGNQINELFVAMARAAGLDAHADLVASRTDAFFHPRVLTERQLSAEVVAVRLGSKDLYLDPACHYCPFGLLPWFEAGAGGIELGRNAGHLMSTPELRSADTVTETRATLQLQPDGTLSGTLQVSFSGEEAMHRRENAREKDEPARRKQLTDEIKEGLPAGSRFDVESVRGWEVSEQPLEIKGTVRLPGFAIPAGKRLLLPLAVFDSRAANPFAPAVRHLPIFFRFPYQLHDDVTIQLPAGFRVEALPVARQANDPFGKYQFSAEEQGGAIHVVRQVEIDDTLLPPDDYAALREFFTQVQAGDGDVAVLQSTGVAASH